MRRESDCTPHRTHRAARAPRTAASATRGAHAERRDRSGRVTTSSGHTSIGSYERRPVQDDVESGRDLVAKHRHEKTIAGRISEHAAMLERPRGKKEILDLSRHQFATHFRDF